MAQNGRQTDASGSDAETLEGSDAEMTEATVTDIAPKPRPKPPGTEIQESPEMDSGGTT